MKFTILLCAFLVTALADTNEVKEKLRAGAQRINAAHESCNNDPVTHIDLDALKKVDAKGKHEKPSNLGAHSLCISKTLGWQNADGSVNAELVRSKITFIYGENSKVDEIVTECTQDQSTPEVTAIHLFYCIKKYTPI